MAQEGWIVVIVKCIVCGKEIYALLEPKDEDLEEYSGFVVCAEATCRHAFEVTFSDGNGLEINIADLGSYIPKKSTEVFEE